MDKDWYYIVCLLLVFSVNMIPSYVHEDLFQPLLAVSNPTTVILYDLTIIIGASIIVVYNYYFKVSGIVSLIIGISLIVTAFIEFDYGIIILNIRTAVISLVVGISLAAGSAPAILGFLSVKLYKRFNHLVENIKTKL